MVHGIEKVGQEDGIREYVDILISRAMRTCTHHLGADLLEGVCPACRERTEASERQAGARGEAREEAKGQGGHADER